MGPIWWVDIDPKRIPLQGPLTLDIFLVNFSNKLEVFSFWLKYKIESFKLTLGNLTQKFYHLFKEFIYRSTQAGYFESKPEQR